jgi:hypothetical protein
MESFKNFRFQNAWNETEERSRGREQRIEAGKGIGNRGEEQGRTYRPWALGLLTGGICFQAPGGPTTPLVQAPGHSLATSRVYAHPNRRLSKHWLL